ncbi:MAG: hypothetical protein ACTHJL_14075, partial [Amnibacterium sp.]
MVQPFVPIRRGGPAAPPPLPRAPDRSVLGPLAPFALDPAVTDLLLDGAGRLWFDAGAGLTPAPGWTPLDPVAARRLAVATLAAGGRHLDDAAPCVDARLPGGIR